MSWRDILKNVFGFGTPIQDNDLEYNIRRLQIIISRLNEMPKKYLYPIDSDNLESFQNSLEQVLRNMPNPPQIKTKNYDKTVSIVEDYLREFFSHENRHGFKDSNRIIEMHHLFKKE